MSEHTDTIAERLFSQFLKWNWVKIDDEDVLVSETISWDNQPDIVKDVWRRAAERGYYLSAGERVYRVRGDGSVYWSRCFVDPSKYGRVERRLGIEQNVKQREERIRARLAKEVEDNLRLSKSHEARAKTAPETIPEGLDEEEAAKIVIADTYRFLAVRLREKADDAKQRLAALV